MAFLKSRRQWNLYTRNCYALIVPQMRKHRTFRFLDLFPYSYGATKIRGWENSKSSVDQSAPVVYKLPPPYIIKFVFRKENANLVQIE